MALVPWPSSTATVTLEAARTQLRDAIGAGTLSDARTDQLGRTAAAHVDRYAAGAPQEVKDEAAIRLAGWLHGSPKSDFMPTSVGPLDFTWRPTVSRNALRQSGAMGLLAPWHRPRAMVLEGES